MLYFISHYSFQGHSITTKRCFKQNSMTKKYVTVILTFLIYNQCYIKHQKMNQSELNYCSVNKAFTLNFDFWHKLL